jgi:lysyl-tRNA synthetase class 2
VTETAETEGQRLKRIRSWLEKRAAICGIIRAFFFHLGFLEVDTPVRSSAIAPELYIDPFQSEGFFLSTSPELYMKRLIALRHDAHCI